MKKQIISEEFSRMQKLAGIINENETSSMDEYGYGKLDITSPDWFSKWEEVAKKRKSQGKSEKEEVAQKLKSQGKSEKATPSLEKIKKALTDIVVNELLPTMYEFDDPDEMEERKNDFIEAISYKTSKEDLRDWWKQEGKEMGYDRDQVMDFWADALENAFT